MPNLSTDAANSGWIRPPVVYLYAILAGAALQWIRPLRFLPGALGMWIGIPVVAAAFSLFFLSVNRFKAAGTPVPGNKPVTSLVCSGPYRWSRNPIYLAFSILQFGIACWLNSLWVLATLVVSSGLMTWVVIPREERYMERRFGPDYLAYKSKVRRWI